MKNQPQQHCCIKNRTEQGDELVHIDCVSHIYPDGSVGIHEMCFRVYQHEIVALCGANGAGKSTLIEHLNGLLEPAEGRVQIRGDDVTQEMKKTLWKTVGLVFQRAEDQLFAPTVLDDVMFGPMNLGLSQQEARTEATRALAAVGALDLAEKIPAYLSGGQKRLAAIAGVLAMKPAVIAMDEPMSDLDPSHAAIVEKIICGLRDQFNISIVISTHDLDLAARIADRICIVKAGSVIAEGTAEEIFYNQPLLAEASLIEPEVVALYRAYCQRRGIRADRHPITRKDLLEAITS
jgi:cobalt/nickel transport system ATP-binding protein